MLLSIMTVGQTVEAGTTTVTLANAMLIKNINNSFGHKEHQILLASTGNGRHGMVAGLSGRRAPTRVR